MSLAAIIAALFVTLFVALAFVHALLCISAYRRGQKEGYAKGRKEIDNWWVEMDSQLDEEWLKIWRQER